MKLSKHKALIFVIVLLQQALQSTAEPSIITIPLEKTKKRKTFGIKHRFRHPPLQDKQRSVLEGVEDVIHRFTLGSGEPELDVDIRNHENTIYSAKLFVGSNLQEFDTYIDTGSNLLVLLGTETSRSSNDCELPARFDNTTSSTFALTGYNDSISYMSGYFVSGFKASDTVSIDSSQTIKATDFSFLYGIIDGGFECFEALLGMMRTDETYPQFQEQLQAQGKIDSKVFSLYLSDYGNDTSSLQLGGYDTSYLRNPLKGITYVPLSFYFNFWAPKINAVRVGLSDYDYDGQTETAWSFTTPNFAVMDSGTTLIYTHNKVFPKLIKAIVKNAVVKKTKEGVYYTEQCDGKRFKPVLLQMGDAWFTIPPSKYLFPSLLPGICIIGFIQSPLDDWTIGDVFLRNYYSVWDHDNNRIGLSPHKTSSADVIPLELLPVPRNQFQPTTAMDTAWEVIRYVWYGITTVSLFGSAFFLADVIIASIIHMA
ncbi:hypothetical protein FGO68_gene15878 [Halteria grandinella]|uniref:Peptidase A1 domain-containing protein n=1 Tax=Halteria grandinella TaxID=5974 RepID=A0A8J8NUF6_HALGN|nr:hypothetical protein FGO68_gene15878 [Halteria grandinella]